MWERSGFEEHRLGGVRGGASVVLVKVLLALGRFGSTCWFGHDDLREEKSVISHQESGNPEQRHMQTVVYINRI